MVVTRHICNVFWESHNPHPLLWTEVIDVCENITFPTLSIWEVKSRYLIFDLMVFGNATSEEFASQQVPVIFQEREVQVPEELNVLVLHLQLHRRIPVDNLQSRP